MDSVYNQVNDQVEADMPPTGRIRLTSAEDAALRLLYRSSDNADVRSRCQMILLSVQGHGEAKIARLSFFDQDTAP